MVVVTLVINVVIFKQLTKDAYVRGVNYQADFGLCSGRELLKELESSIVYSRWWTLGVYTEVR